MSEPRVTVRCMTRDQPGEDTRVFLNLLKGEQPDWSIGRIRNKYSIEMGRCQAVANARLDEADFLIMVDDDIALPPRLLTRLVEHDKPVIGGIVPTVKDGLIVMNAFHLAEDKSFFYTVLPFGNREEPEEVYAVGTAILCIRKDVIGRMDLDPLFENERNPDGTLTHPFGGEDVFFCRKMQQEGIPVFIDYQCQGEHYVKTPLLQILQQGQQHAHTDPNHCFPSVFKFDVSQLPVDFPADAYFRRRRDSARPRPDGPLPKVFSRDSVLGGE